MGETDVTQYPADFAASAPYEPVEPTLFLGVSPLLLGLLALLGVLLAAAGWWFGRREAAKIPDGAASIWKAVDGAIKDAMKADDNAIAGKAEALRDTLRKRLGNTLGLARGLAGPLGALDKALEGKAPEGDKAKTGAEPGGHGHGPAHGAGQGPETVKVEGAHDAGPGGAGGAASAAAAGASVTIVNVTPVAPAPAPAPPSPPQPAPAAPPAKLDAQARNNAIRLAVAALNQHWLHREARIGELRAAWRELSGDAR